MTYAEIFECLQQNPHIYQLKSRSLLEVVEAACPLSNRIQSSDKSISQVTNHKLANMFLMLFNIDGKIVMTGDKRNDDVCRGKAASMVIMACQILDENGTRACVRVCVLLSCFCG